MNDKEKQIEEMAKIIKTANEINCIRTCDNCEYYEDDVKCISFGQAIALYNAGYRKLPKDSVVLSKEEWECLHTDYAKALYNVRQNAIKETAEKILDLLVPDCKACDENWHSGCLCLRATLAEKIAKQFGVDLGE